MLPSVNCIYRKDIDGLRGIAVLLVLFNHLGWGIAAAGFIGVDIFFVISGFLITSHIIKEIQNQTFTLKKFYMRRMRRILPALVTILICSSIAAYFLLLPADLKAYGQSLVATVFSMSNIYFWKYIHVGYFSTDATLLPLLHTWSLGVEEQFYILWPVFFLLIFKLFSGKKLPLLLITAILIVLSFFAYCFFKSNMMFIYYSPITRAFELLAGACLALIFEKNYLIKGQYVNHVTSIIGLCFIAYSGCILTEKDYPGFTILWPCVGAMLLILTGRNQDSLAIINRILSHKILIFIGLISYSLYLWHWPIIAYFNYFKIAINVLSGLMIVLVSALLSFITWKYVECPFRYQVIFPFNQTFSLFGVFPTVIAVIFCLSALYNNDFGYNQIPFQQFQEAEDYYGTLKKEFGCIDNKEGAKVLPSKQLCRLGDLGSKKISALLVGDSHAEAITGMLTVLLKEVNLQAYVVTQSGSPFILGDIANWRANNPMDRNRLLQETIKNGGYKYIVMAGFWDYYPLDILENGLRNAIKFIIADGKTPVLFLDNPPLMNVLKTCGLSKISFGYCFSDRSQIEKIQEKSRKIILGLKREFSQIILIDPSKVICDRARCYSSRNGVPLYSSDGENSHLSFAGSTLIGELYLKKYGNPFDGRSKYGKA